MNWREPDYAEIIAARTERLKRLRADPILLEANKIYYKDHPADFVNEWGWTYDPRNIERGLPSLVPFVLFPIQFDWFDHVMYCWKRGEPGLTEKSRDMGATWCAISLACTLSLFYRGMAIGFGSRKAEYVDQLGVPKSILQKGRIFMRMLPKEFRGSWNERINAPHMRIDFPDTGSIIAGESGDAIGRGDRTSIYFVDEAAHLERPQLVDASLSATTNCRQDISSVIGRANSFAIRRFSGKVKVFTMHWRSDPTKDDAWYKKKKDQIVDPIVMAQEYDIDYSASVQGIVIPAAWIQASIDAHKHLNITPTGIRSGSLDVADEGLDSNAFGTRHGILLKHAESWRGVGSDIYATTEKAFLLCDLHNIDGFVYDADGLGAGVRGDARRINEARHKGKKRVTAYRGSAAVVDPESNVEGTERTNEDMFENFKAQSWFSLRRRFLNTFRAREGMPYKASDIISIDSTIPECGALCVELSQPTYGMSKHGKMLIEKKPDGAASPNLADMVCMLYAPLLAPIAVNPAFLEPQYASGPG